MKNLMNIKDAITSFIFLEDEITASDVAIIPGSSKPEVCIAAAELYKKGLIKKVVANGKYSVKSGVFNSEYIKGTEFDGNFDTEAEFEKSVLLKSGVKEEDIILEDQSSGIEFIWIRNVEHKPVPMNSKLRDIIKESSRNIGAEFTELPSGAFHDSLLMAERYPTAMIFVPTIKGISHSPY